MTTYCDSTDVTIFSQINYKQVNFASDAAYLAWITGTLILKAQDMIDNYVGHNFYENYGTIRLDGSGKEVEHISPHGLTVYSNQRETDATGVLKPSRLLPLPLMAITGVNIDSTAQTVTDFQIYESYVAYDGNRFCKGRQNVDIIGTWGYGTYPHDIQYVTAQLCANALREMIRSEMMPDLITPILESGQGSVGGLSALFRSPRVLTQNEKDILNKYKYYKLEVG